MQNEVDRLTNTDEFGGNKLKDLTKQLGELKSKNIALEQDLTEVTAKMKSNCEAKNKMQVTNLELQSELESVTTTNELLQSTLKIRDTSLAKKVVLWDEKFADIEEENSRIKYLAGQMDKFFMNLSDNQDK